MPISLKKAVNLNLLTKESTNCVVPELLTRFLTDDLYKKNAGKGGHLNWCGKSLHVAAVSRITTADCLEQSRGLFEVTLTWPRSVN